MNTASPTLAAHTAPQQFTKVQDAVDYAIHTLGHSIVVGTPLGIGKPNTFLNALYTTVKQNPQLQLHLLTALTLITPQAQNDVEARFLKPFAQRVFGNYPELLYALDRKKQALPHNIRVTEFFLKSGEYIHNKIAQQDYLYSNYTHVARDMELQGVNLLVQAVAVRYVNGEAQYSLSSNPDVTLDLIDRLAHSPRKTCRILVVNEALPFMENDALVDLGYVDAIVHDPAATHTLFSAPNMKVQTAEYLIGLYVSALVQDGGTLQIGIGSLGDAIAHALILRQHHPEAYTHAINALYAHLHNIEPHVQPFQQGLYGCSEMFVNGFIHLIEQGIVKREVFNDERLQHAIVEGFVDPHAVSVHTLTALAQHGYIHATLQPQDLVWLNTNGFFTQPVTFNTDATQLCINEHMVSPQLDNTHTQQALARIINTQLPFGHFMMGGFFLGPRDFYTKLHQLPDAVRQKIYMTRITRINHLHGHENLSRLQRQHACFVNTCMMMSLTGQVISDSIEHNTLISGVGGQYNFVAQAHELPNARSIMMMRATRYNKGELESNFVWQYPACTIPRHLRDMVVTEYGIADLRGQTDAEVIKRLLNIADSRFQHTLLEQAVAQGKLEADYQIPTAFRHNLPETQYAKIALLKHAQLLPDFPFGHDFTDEELAIIAILERLKSAKEHPVELIKSFVTSFFKEEDTIPEHLLERMGLDHADDLKTKLIRQLFIGNI